MQKPLVTVITSYYNDQSFLADAISSVLAQTYTNFEYILVNHASTDKSRAVAHSFTDPRIKHIDLPVNYGGSGNILIQKALEIAQGEYIKMLCADDLLRPDGLEILVQAATMQKADLLFGNVAFIGLDKEPLFQTWFTDRYPAHKPAVTYLQYLIKGASCFPYAGNLIRANVLRQAAMDYVSIQLADMNLWATLLLNGAKLAFANEMVAQYRVHPNQLCSSSRLDIIGLRCQFEHIRFYQHILETKPSLALLKELFPQDDFITQLTPSDQPFFAFCFARALYRQNVKPACTLACRIQLARMLDDYALQQQLEKRFSFTVRDLRKDIVQSPILLLPIRYNLAQPQGGKCRQFLRRMLRKMINGCLFLGWKWKRRREKTHSQKDAQDFV